MASQPVASLWTRRGLRFEVLTNSLWTRRGLRFEVLTNYHRLNHARLRLLPVPSSGK